MGVPIVTAMAPEAMPLRVFIQKGISDPWFLCKIEASKDEQVLGIQRNGGVGGEGGWLEKGKDLSEKRDSVVVCSAPASVCARVRDKPKLA